MPITTYTAATVAKKSSTRPTRTRPGAARNHSGISSVPKLVESMRASTAREPASAAVMAPTSGGAAPASSLLRCTRPGASRAGMAVVRTMPTLWGRGTTLDERSRDVRDALGLAAVGVLLIAVGLVGALPPAVGTAAVDRWWFALPLAGLCALVLTKRRHPLAALAGGAAVLALDLALGGSTGSVLGFVDLVLGAALYASRAAVRRLEAVVGVLGTPLWWGRDVRRQTEIARLEAARADDAARLAALRAADATHTAREAVAADLHDALAGDLAAIAIHAEAALAVPRGDEPLPSLTVIRSSSTSALTHLREMVTLLRSGASAEPAPRRLGDLDDLVNAARGHGLSVVVQDRRCAGDLPEPVDLVAGRIVAEALTNAVKHAPGADVTITLDDASDHGLRVEVVSARGSGTPGAPLDGTAPGVGVVLMRERAASVGGVLDAGPVGDAWVVRARLPLPARAGDPAVAR